MEIKDLQPGQGSVNIEATVKSVEEPKTIDKYGKQLRLTNAMISDGSGEIKLTLWNEDVDKVKPEMKIRITNGYVNEFNGEKQLTSGKFGKLEILDGSEESTESENEESTTESEPTSEEPTEPASEEKEEEKEVVDY